MNAPPDLSNPYKGLWNPSLPVHNGSIAASFVAFGWFRDVFNTALPEFANDMAYAAGLHGGVLV